MGTARVCWSLLCTSTMAAIGLLRKRPSLTPSIWLSALGLVSLIWGCALLPGSPALSDNL